MLHDFIFNQRINTTELWSPALGARPPPTPWQPACHTPNAIGCRGCPLIYIPTCTLAFHGVSACHFLILGMVSAFELTLAALHACCGFMPLPVSLFLQSRRILLLEFCVGPSESLHALHVPVAEWECKRSKIRAGDTGTYCPPLGWIAARIPNW